MTHRTPIIAGILLLGLLILASSTFFIVGQTEQALVLEFGRPVAVYRTPGLKFKRPFIQNVVRFDNRLLELYARTPREVTTSDNKRLIVDWFVRYRITDPLKFKQAFPIETNLQTQLTSILESMLGQAIGQVEMRTLLSEKRVEVMHDIRTLVNAMAQGQKVQLPQGEGGGTKTLEPSAKGGFGIEIVDVRIKRTDLPPQNSEAIYRRMKTQREKEAKQIRATGDEEALKIKARADKERVITLAEAQQQAETTRGEGDALASKISGDAFGRDPEFYDFYRTLQAYRATLTGTDTRMVLSPDSQFLKEMNTKP